MQRLYKFLIFSALYMAFSHAAPLQAQVSIRGKVVDSGTGEELIGAAVAILGSGGGSVTDYEGNFLVKVEKLPVWLRVSYTGYSPLEVEVTKADERLDVRLSTNAIVIAETVIRGQRIDDKQKAAPLSVEKLDAIAIKETPSVSFYNGLGNLKGVDLTTASLGFTVINMRGFNSTSPVRSLQIIDGVDNQAPGLNFSLGNFLGASELDVNSVDLVAGASGPFYGPNAFNGVISMESKNPFVHKGLAVSLKAGERNLFEGAIRWGQALRNRSGKDFLAYKLNFYHLRAYDWVADNYDPVFDTETGRNNPGRYDAVNRYGDEYNPGLDLTGESPWAAAYPLGVFHRTGYNEVDLVDYNTRNYKANAALHFRLRPSQEFESPELILASSFGSGTTVYQGDNRFSLRNILFFQNRIELRKKDKYFLRAYATNEDAGDSYDPYFTALRLQRNAKTDELWKSDYSQHWVQLARYQDRMKQLGYPQLTTMFDPVTGQITFNFNDSLANLWFMNYADTLFNWHNAAQAWANRKSNQPGQVSESFYQPGTPEFEREFARITQTNSGSAGGTRFFDKSALYHVHGEYRFAPRWANYWVVGGNYRLYRPYSEGTIFSDSILNGQRLRITNSEVGAYTGVEKKLADDKVTLAGTLRADKNQNFDLLLTPAVSVVWKPREQDFLRFSFSSAIRNPTLTDQYLFLNVGPAILVGNLNGFDSLVTIESFREALENPQAIETAKFQYFNVAPIRPEKVKTFELGYRTTLFNQLYVDAGYYYNIYDDFIGFNIGLDVPVTMGFVNINGLQAYRVAANSTNTVTTLGFNIGLNYYFNNYYQLSGNYSWNRLNTNVDDPIIPAFNTPEHKFNLGFSGRDMRIGRLKQTGFNVTYKWIEGFVFEGSPQFTGAIPTYDMVDAQWNCTIKKWHTTFKIGATNIFGIAPLFQDVPEGSTKLKEMFNNRQFQTYGGPRIGRMAYVGVTYDFNPDRK
jgi:outer membrane receptor protein involved in Fe transport